MDLISVVIPTYKRDWALLYSLSSLREQTRTPDEVVVVLKPSGDRSREVIDKFSNDLNINLVIQEKGNFTDAISIGIEASHGDLILFLDDDAIAENCWIEKYSKIFTMLPDAGGVSGITYVAFKNKNEVIKTMEKFYDEMMTQKGPHRRPLDIFKDYDEYISDSGFPGRSTSSALIIRSALLSGVNMAWRREALYGNNLSRIFSESKIGHLNEGYLACSARLKGYHTYRIIDPKISPIVWHIKHQSSLQRKPLWSEFWRSFDLAYSYWRLKYLKCSTSFLNYIAGMIILSRRKPFLRIPAFIYGFVKGFLFYTYTKYSKGYNNKEIREN